MHPDPQFNSAELSPHWLQLSPAGRLKMFLSRWRWTNCINTKDVFCCVSMTPTDSQKWHSRIAWYYHLIVYEWSYEQRPYLFPSRGGVTYPFFMFRCRWLLCGWVHYFHSNFKLINYLLCIKFIFERAGPFWDVLFWKLHCRCQTCCWILVSLFLGLTHSLI